MRMPVLLRASPVPRHRCLHVGQVPVTVLAARAGRSFPARVRACGPCAEILSSPQTPAAEPTT